MAEDQLVTSAAVLAAGLARLAPYAAARGIVLALKGWPALGDDPRALLDLAHRLGASSVGTFLDTAGACRYAGPNGGVPPAIERLAHATVHTHTGAGREAAFRATRLGTGELDIGRVLKPSTGSASACRKLQYEGADDPAVYADGCGPVRADDHGRWQDRWPPAHR